ncbi:MAG: SGNH/GDSL hydrolase family protein, partial [Leptospiraceae bacterium]|nr:SGNH/GDSL hydrolase family protein [Leptospiraceae bacterium]
GGTLFQKVVVENKDYIDGILLLIGGNNILFIEHVLKRRAKPSEVVPEILALIQDLQTELPNIPIYVGNYPMSHVMSPEMYQALEEVRTNTFGVKEGPDVYSRFLNRWDLYMKDYLHLNEEGQKLLALLWEEHLKKDGWK